MTPRWWIDRVLWLLAAASLSSVVMLSLTPVPPRIPAFHLSDKVLHAGHYALVTALILLAAAWRPGRGDGRFAGAAPAIVLGMVALGGLLELLQGLGVVREPDAVDWLADTVGVLWAAGAWQAVRRRGPQARSATTVPGVEPADRSPSHPDHDP